MVIVFFGQSNSLTQMRMKKSIHRLDKCIQNAMLRSVDHTLGNKTEMGCNLGSILNSQSRVIVISLTEHTR